MNLERCIAILTEHNKWRRSEPPYDYIGAPASYEPQDIGEAIDCAVNVLNGLKQ